MSGRYTWRLRLECGHSVIWGPHDNEGNRREAGQIAACEICPNPALAERKIVEVNNVKTMLTLNSPTTGEVIRLDNLIDRLNAALDEDERDGQLMLRSFTNRTDLSPGHIEDGFEEARGKLRRAEGARKILALHPLQTRTWDNGQIEYGCPCSHWCETGGDPVWSDQIECPTILALAEMFGVEP